MKAVGDTRIDELDFCSQIATYATAICGADPRLPYKEARIEGVGYGRKRKDLRIYDRSGKLALCGEVKMPGTQEGRSPYDGGLIRDAHQKADDAGVRFSL